MSELTCYTIEYPYDPLAHSNKTFSKSNNF